MLIVAGEPRSGTSMMMQIVKGLGLQVIGDKYIHDWNKDLNPGGIYEVENLPYLGLTKEVLNGEVTHISDKPLVGDVIKITTQALLKSDPSIIDKVILCIRDPREVIVSQRKQQKPRSDADNWGLYLKHMVALYEAIEPEDFKNLIIVDYGDIMWSPRAEVKRVADFLGVQPTDEARNVPNPEHYRSKKHKAKVNSVGKAAIRMYETFRRMM